MQTTYTRLLAWICALLMLLTAVPVMSVSAAAEYPNTHINTGNMAVDIVSVAETQAGYCEGSLSGNPSYASSNNYQKYGLWYDNNVDYIGVQRAAWCAAFVSWCANQAGVPSSIVYYHAYCPYGVNWFRNQGRFQYAASRGGSYVPKAGDIVYFAPAGSSVSSHIGIVRYSSGGRVYTVEGNTGSQNGEINEGGGVFMKSYSLSYERLYGYGIPAYQDNSGHTISFDSNGGTAVGSVNVREGNCLTPPADPSRFGFNFGGWYCNPELTDPYDFSTPVAYGFTLYAKWEEGYFEANTDLMPKDGSLTPNDYNGTGQSIWPYYNSDGSVTLYQGVSSDWAWPDATMEYANSFDSNNDTYIYVRKDGTAKFNAEITYMAADGAMYKVTLSELAGRGSEDFEAGYAEFFVDLGDYARRHGHVPDSGNLKYTKVSYYAIGPLDSYVKLYDMKLTPMFDTVDPYVNLYDRNVQQGGKAGCYTYDGGTLYASSTADEGYSVTFTPNATIDPAEFGHLLMDVQSTVPFNVSMDITSANGDATIEFRKEFFDVFGYTEAPDAIAAGTWKTDMNLNGYFYYNGGLVDSVTIRSITITLEGKGDLSLAALQAHRSFNTAYVTNEIYETGSYTAPSQQLGDINGDGEITTTDARIAMLFALDGTTLTDEQRAAADMNGDGDITTLDARLMMIEALQS